MTASLAAVLLLAASVGASDIIVVTGAAGRTGSLIYKQLKADARVSEVRALVTSLTKAKSVLGCHRCDQSEGIFVGDVTVPATLDAAFEGASLLAIAVGSSSINQTAEAAVEWHGVENQVNALVKGGASTSDLRVCLISSMGTTQKNPPPFEGGPDLFWKLQAETFLLSAGVGGSVVKPCGLGTKPAGRAPIIAGHDDVILLNRSSHSTPIGRADVAAIVVEILLTKQHGLRFDVCSTLEKAPPTSPAEVIEAGKWPWQRE